MASQVLSGLRKLEMESMAGRGLEIENPVDLYAAQFFASLLNAWQPIFNTIKAVSSLASSQKARQVLSSRSFLFILCSLTRRADLCCLISS